MDTITYDDFAKCELRSGTVTKAVAVPKSNKLLQLEVDFGPVGTRVILAGVAKSFPPEEMIGKSVVAVLNLAPRTMFGIESHGMLLAASREDGLISLIQCVGVPNGSEIG